MYTYVGFEWPQRVKEATAEFKGFYMPEAGKLIKMHQESPYTHTHQVSDGVPPGEAVVPSPRLALWPGFSEMIFVPGLL